jgi:hypothetical protein
MFANPRLQASDQPGNGLQGSGVVALWCRDAFTTDLNALRIQYNSGYFCAAKVYPQPERDTIHL